MKGAFVRVNFMETAEDEPHFDVNEFITREVSACHRIADAFHRRLDKLTRNHAARDFIFKDKTFIRRGFNFDFDVRVLSATARLLLENFFAGRGLRDRLTICDLRFADVRSYGK